MSADLFSIRDLRSKDGNGPVSVADYLAYAVAECSAGQDIVSATIRLFWPCITTVGDELLVEEVGALSRFKQLIEQGVPAREAPYWANMLDIAQFLQRVPFDQVTEVAHALAGAWQLALERQHRRHDYRVEALIDVGEGEAFVTCSRHWPS